MLGSPQTILEPGGRNDSASTEEMRKQLNPRPSGTTASTSKQDAARAAVFMEQRYGIPTVSTMRDFERTAPIAGLPNDPARAVEEIERSVRATDDQRANRTPRLLARRVGGVMGERAPNMYIFPEQTMAELSANSQQTAKFREDAVRYAQRWLSGELPLREEELRGVERAAAFYGNSLERSIYLLPESLQMMWRQGMAEGAIERARGRAIAEQGGNPLAAIWSGKIDEVELPESTQQEIAQIQAQTMADLLPVVKRAQEKQQELIEKYGLENVQSNFTDDVAGALGDVTASVLTLGTGTVAPVTVASWDVVEQELGPIEDLTPEQFMQASDFVEANVGMTFVLEALAVTRILPRPLRRKVSRFLSGKGTLTRKELLKALGDNPPQRVARAAAEGGLGEGVTEALQGVNQDVLANLIIDADIDVFSRDRLAGYLYQGVVGATAGAGVSGTIQTGTEISSRLRSRAVEPGPIAQPESQPEAEPESIPQPESQPAEVPPIAQPEGQEVDVPPIAQPEGQEVDVPPIAQPEEQPVNVPPIAQPENTTPGGRRSEEDNARIERIVRTTAEDDQPMIEEAVQVGRDTDENLTSKEYIDFDLLAKEVNRRIENGETPESVLKGIDARIAQLSKQARKNGVKIRRTSNGQGGATRRSSRAIRSYDLQLAEITALSRLSRRIRQKLDEGEWLGLKVRPLSEPVEGSTEEGPDPIPQPEAQPVEVPPIPQPEGQEVDVPPIAQPESQPVEVPPITQPEGQQVDVPSGQTLIDKAVQLFRPDGQVDPIQYNDLLRARIVINELEDLDAKEERTEEEESRLQVLSDEIRTIRVRMQERSTLLNTERSDAGYREAQTSDRLRAMLDPMEGAQDLEWDFLNRNFTDEEVFLTALTMSDDPNVASLAVLAKNGNPDARTQYRDALTRPLEESDSVLDEFDQLANRYRALQNVSGVDVYNAQTRRFLQQRTQKYMQEGMDAAEAQSRAEQDLTQQEGVQTKAIRTMIADYRRVFDKALQELKKARENNHPSAELVAGIYTAIQSMPRSLRSELFKTSRGLSAFVSKSSLDRVSRKKLEQIEADIDRVDSVVLGKENARLLKDVENLIDQLDMDAAQLQRDMEAAVTAVQRDPSTTNVERILSLLRKQEESLQRMSAAEKRYARALQREENAGMNNAAAVRAGETAQPRRDPDNPGAEPGGVFSEEQLNEMERAAEDAAKEREDQLQKLAVLRKRLFQENQSGDRVKVQETATKRFKKLVSRDYKRSESRRKKLLATRERILKSREKGEAVRERERRLKDLERQKARLLRDVLSQEANQRLIDQAERQILGVMEQLDNYAVGDLQDRLLSALQRATRNDARARKTTGVVQSYIRLAKMTAGLDPNLATKESYLAYLTEEADANISPDVLERDARNAKARELEGSDLSEEQKQEVIDEAAKTARQEAESAIEEIYDVYVGTTADAEPVFRIKKVAPAEEGGKPRYQVTTPEWFQRFVPQAGTGRIFNTRTEAEKKRAQLKRDYAAPPPTAARVVQATEDLKALQTGGRTKVKEAKARTQAKRDEVEAKILQNLPAQTGRPVPSAQDDVSRRSNERKGLFRTVTEDRWYRIFEPRTAAEYGMGLLMQARYNLFYRHMDLKLKAESLDELSGDDFFFRTLFVPGFRNELNEHTEFRVAMDEVFNRLDELYFGGNLEGKWGGLRKMLDAWSEQVAPDQHGVRLYPDTDTNPEGVGLGSQLTRGQALNIFNHWFSPGQAAMRRQGYTEQTIDQIVQFIGLPLSDLMQINQIFKDIYAEWGAAASRVNEQITGYPIARINGYVGPFARDRKPDSEEDTGASPAEQTELFTMSGGQLTASFGSLSNERNEDATSELVFDDAVDVLMSYIAKTNHFIHYGEYALTVVNAFLQPKVRRAIVDRYGPEFYRDLVGDSRAPGDLITAINRNFSERAEMQNEQDLVRRVMNLTTAGVLAVNPVSAIKQSASGMAYLQSMGYDIPTYLNYSNDLLDTLFTDPQKGWEMIKPLVESDYFQMRWLGNANPSVQQSEVLSLQNVRKVLRDRRVDPKKPLQSIANMSWMQRLLFLTKGMDANVVILAGFPVYQAQKDKLMTQGLTEEEAQPMAVEAWAMATDPVQQSIMKVHQPTWYRNPGLLAYLYRQFIIAPLKYYITGLVGAVRSINLARKGYTQGKISKESARRQMKIGMADFSLYWIAMPLIFNSMGAVAEGLINGGGDEEQWENFLRRVRRSLIFGPLEGLPILGSIVSAGGSRIINAIMGEEYIASFGKEGMAGFLAQIAPPTLSIGLGALKDVGDRWDFFMDNLDDPEAWIDMAQAIGDSSQIGFVADRVDAVYDFVEGDGDAVQALIRFLTGRSAYQTGVVDR